MRKMKIAGIAAAILVLCGLILFATIGIMDRVQDRDRDQDARDVGARDSQAQQKETTRDQDSDAQDSASRSEEAAQTATSAAVTELEVTELFAHDGSSPRSGIERKGFIGVTIHNAAEFGVGSGAVYLATMLRTEWTKEFKSWHYAVDEAVITQSIPEEEIAWHAGDGEDGGGTGKTISIEICDNVDGDILLATDRAAALAANILREHGIEKAVSDETIFQHNHWSPLSKDCPHEIRAGVPYDWDAFVKKVNEFLQSGEEITIKRK
jgi:hypothetical protein